MQTVELQLDTDIVGLTAQLVNIPSESWQEQALADAVAAALADYPHLQVVRLGNNVIARTHTGAGQRVILAGHLDTVPAADNQFATVVRKGELPPEGCGTQPVTEDRLYGLGSCDMKGGVAVALLMAAQVRQPNRDLTFVFYAREEIASIHSGLGEIVAAQPDLLTDADMAILLEPSDAGVEAGCQGTLRFVLSTRGVRAHSARSWRGRNAIHAMSDSLRTLEQFQPQRVEIDGLEYREGLNAVGISGGVAGNVIPDECQLTINYRFAPDKSAAQAFAYMQEVFAGFTLELTDSAEGAMPGLTQPAMAEFLSFADTTPRPKFGWTDVARFSAMGIPALNFGPGDPQLAHTRAEYTPLAQLHTVVGTLRSWLS